MKNLIIGIFLGLLFITSAMASEKEDFYNIGMIASLTGSGAFWGELTRNGAQLAVDEINRYGGVKGKKLKLTVYDNGTDATKTIQMYKRLYLDQNIKATILTAVTPENMAVRSIINKEPMPVIGLSSGHVLLEPVNKWVFGISPTDILVLEKIFEDLNHKKVKKLACLNVNSAFGKSGNIVIAKLAKENNIEVVLNESYSPTDKDMTSQLTKIRASKAEALISWGIIPGTPIVAKQVKQLGIKLPVYTSHGTASKKFVELAGDSSNGVYVVVPKIMMFNQLNPKEHQNYNEMKKFLEEYNNKYKVPLDSLMISGYNAVKFIAKAIENSQEYTRESLRNSIERTSMKNTTGISKFSPTNHRGSDTLSNMMLCKWKNGEFEVVR